MTTICCIGAGYVGGPTMAMIAKMCPHVKVTVVDISAERIAAWNSDNLPIYEPGLNEIVQACRGKNLFFSSDVEKGIAEHEIIFVSVNTPTKTYGKGAGKGPDLSYWESAARTIAATSSSDKIIVEKSTVPVRTAAALKSVLQATSKVINGRRIHFEVLSNPEFLAEGTAIRDLEEPDRVLIGGENTPTGQQALAKMVSVYANWVPQDRIITTNLWSSEISKLAANAFLAQRISSINAMSAVCEETGADVDEVAHAIGLDKRIGRYFLKSSVGFGGSCFKKDILNLVYICESLGLQEHADYWSQVVSMNELQKKRFVNRIVREMFSLRKKKLTLLGFAFKKDTGDTRESAAIDVCKQLLEEGAMVHIFDPKVPDEYIWYEMTAATQLDRVTLEKNIIIHHNVTDAIKNSHALIVVTEWDEFKNYDYTTIFANMEKPAFVFDGRNILPHDQLRELGFKVHAIGKPGPENKINPNFSY